MSGGRHCFYILLLALCSVLATFSSTIPVFSALHCVFHTPAFDATGNFCHTGGWYLRRKSCVELLYVALFPYGILASRFCVLVACMPYILLLWTLTKPMWNVTEFRRFAKLPDILCPVHFCPFSLCRVLVIRCPHVTGKGHSSCTEP